MEVIEKFLSLLAVPLAILNIFGGIVSGIWLAILGEWSLIGFGVLAFFVSGMLVGLAMTPGLIFAMPAAAMLEKGNKIGGFIFGFLGTLYTVGVLTAWCVLVLVYCIKQANAESIIPVLIWSYGIATGPIIWLAQKDLQTGSIYAMITTFFIEIAYVLTILGILLIGMSLIDVLFLFGIVMGVGLITQHYIAYMLDKNKSYF